ncbi:hypothetical protein LEP1GSC195_0946 [Leptospira wolbachii serovar Codice str. CDC]|uniref:Uncharacterized protein n=1 Tax=Leptospira wolbachii serovar Codice str. CDC TaxID=1218599 RepID=R9A7A4_9LEPT|nr:hypothetical protein LEP1GSC195_0946 [Leptospira wolbachii serovar Codice str. CDC]
MVPPFSFNWNESHRSVLYQLNGWLVATAFVAGQICFEIWI